MGKEKITYILYIRVFAAVGIVVLFVSVFLLSFCTTWILKKVPIINKIM